MTEYFMEAYVNEFGYRYKPTRAGRGLKAPVKLYINGTFHQQFDSAKAARKAGRNYGKEG